MTLLPTVDPTLEELVSLLGKFPPNVLPEAVMRAIVSRDDAANDVLLSRLDAAAQNTDGGLSSIPPESFFCFALLHNSPDIRMLSTLGRVFETNETVIDKVVGELRHGFVTSLIVRMSNSDTFDTVRAWVGEVLQNPKVNEFVRWNLAMVVPHWVNRDLMTRQAGIAQLKSWLERRSDEHADTLSAGILCEMLTMKAIEEKPFIQQCFDQDQIDQGVVDREYALSELEDSEPYRNELNEYLQSNDLIGYFKSWHGFPKSSLSIDPHDLILEDNRQPTRMDKFRPQQADPWFAAIRNSNDKNYPRDAVDKLIRHASDLTDRLADEVRWGLNQAGGPNSQASNGPFVAATILIAQQHVPYTDILLDILDLSPDQRMDVFGDAIEPSVVAALAFGLLGGCEPIDIRITDSKRDSLDRSCMAFFYPLSVAAGYLGRQDCIDRLTDLLDRSLDENTDDNTFDLSESLYDALCLMSVGDDNPVIGRARQQGVFNRFISDEQANQCIDDPSQASKVVWGIIREHQSPLKAIESSVMFDRAAIKERSKPKRPANNPARMPRLNEPSARPVNDAGERVPRNAACTCGSGKKYKKCCGKK